MNNYYKRIVKIDRLIKRTAVYILSILVLASGAGKVFAMTDLESWSANFGSQYCQLDKNVAMQASDAPLCRGKGVYIIATQMGLASKNADFLGKCALHKDECYFVFGAMSDYSIQFEPLILYPDVFPANQYYGAINLATTLGLVRGYTDEKSTPFHPEAPMTMIQALKVLLIANGNVPWKEKFELTQNELNAYKPEGSDKWWYGRYLNFALNKGMIDQKQYDNPDEIITSVVLQNLIYQADPNDYSKYVQETGSSKV